MAVVSSPPVEEAQHFSEVQWDKSGEGGKGFLQGRVGGRALTSNAEAGLEGVAVLMEREGVPEVEEATLGEVAGIMNMTPVEEGEDLTMLERISRMNVVTLQLDMVK